ncbi:MAG: Hsp70 family protein, partial [Myxococcota bacterium]
PLHEAVVGRPVRFVSATSEEDEALALTRLRASLTNAGFRRVRFEHEPIGAARHYERGLERDELLLIGDFGGGTSDFSLLRVGPGRKRGSGAEAILGNDGVDVAGDAFDGKIIRHCVAPLLGRGAEFVSFFGRTLPVPDWLYAHLERWHHVSMLKSRRTMQLLLDLRREATEPERLDRLLRVVENDLGFVLHRATEQTKRALSGAETARFRVVHDVLAIDAEVTRADFETWIAPELSAIAGCVDGLLARAGIEAGAVDRVFLTGGSSQVPAVRRIFEERFPGERIRSGDEFTSVASGLALCASEDPPESAQLPAS